MRDSLTSFKQFVKYFLEKCFFKVGSQIFRQIIGILMGLHSASIFISLRI